MKKAGTVFLLLLCCGVALLAASCRESKKQQQDNNSAPATDTIEGKVIKISDGDTFTILSDDNQQQRIRLHGIDCPEKAQDFGTVARTKMGELVFGRRVKVVVKDTDRYGRTVALVYTEDGNCVNEELLKAGLAWHYTQYDQNRVWAAMEQTAKRKKIGLWSQPNPVPPWEWRRTKRNNPPLFIPVISSMLANFINKS